MPPGTPLSGGSGGAESGADSGREAAVALGQALAAARESAGLSVDQVADTTRIRTTLIRSIEAGRFGPCGGHVYARGHLRSIAAAIGVPAQPFIDDYDALSGQTDTVVRTAPAKDRYQSSPVGLSDLGGKRRAPASGWLIAAVAAAAVLALGIGISVVRGGGGGGPAALDAAPSTSVSSPGGGRSDAPTPSVSQTIAYAGVNVVVNITGSPCWVYATDETGAVVFQGTLASGQVKEVHAAERLKFVFGNAPAVTLVVNGKSIGQPPANSSQVATVSIDANTATTGKLG